jgi:hypothetical protein
MTTPLGSPVLPEVKTTYMVDCGSLDKVPAKVFEALEKYRVPIARIVGARSKHLLA